MLARILEPEVMDSAAEAHDYDTMDHSHVNQLFIDDLLQIRSNFQTLLDVGTGTAQIPIALCAKHSTAQIVAIDMAQHMLRVGQVNVERAGLTERIRLQYCDAKRMPFAAATFDGVISNSIIHHIPEPFAVLAEMVRVVQSGGQLFVRDLLRPVDETALRAFVQQYAGDANAHQQQMFADSLHAALALDEVRALVSRLGFDVVTVQQTSDRHWTWVATSA
jgi:ubiquinone/menaquinone biosynthesis C-methylase UbiE